MREAPQLSAIFLALADDRRRDMVVRLSRHALSAKELAGPPGMRLPSAVKHLATLEAGGIILSNKVGRVRTYRINPAAFSAINQWVEARQMAMNAAFDRLDQAIAAFPEESDK